MGGGRRPSSVPSGTRAVPSGARAVPTAVPTAVPSGVPVASRAARAGWRRVLLPLAATALALAGTLAPAAAPIARAATGDLRLTTATTYTIVPARHVVHVVVDITARNDKPNVTAGGLVTKYFYDSGRIAVQTEATAIAATSGGVRLATSTTPADGYRILEVRFRSSLFYRQTALVHVTFDLPGGAPRSTSDIRVGSAFATFVAWAFGDGGSVRVVVPAGFDAQTTGSDVSRAASGGATVFRASAITAVASWYLVVNADRKSALTSDRVDLSGGEHLVIRAWPEDATWRKDVRDLLTRGLPALVQQTGLAWPVAADISVLEVHTPLLEGYGGVFIEGKNEIEISEDLDNLTIVHEASHAWFNSDLFVGRWIDEGLADTYAARALDSLGIVGSAPDAVSPTDAAAVRLSAWTFPGRITDKETNAREAYGYNAAWTVVRSIVTEIGAARMQAVLAAAQTHRIAYAGAGTPETVSGANDWRRLLDLLDEVGGSTTADDTIRRWVVTDAEATELDARAAARSAYAALVRAGGDWQTPFFVRGPMSDWNFPVATSRIAAATTLLARRDAIAAIVAPLGVTPPVDLRTAYQAASDSLDDANRLAAQEEAAARALATASEVVAAPRAPLVSLGLLGTTPEDALADARSAFSAGLADAGARADAVTALIDGAADVGRDRLKAALAALGVAIVLVVIAIVVLRRRTRRFRRARAGAALGAAGVASYATLADQSDRPLDPDPSAPEPAPQPGPEPPDPAPPAAPTDRVDPASADGEPSPDQGDAS